ncbi:TPA: restriction endonuclease subunit S, partial [Salmonella enterica subsp. enterica serovar Aberdeen]
MAVEKLIVDHIDTWTTALQTRSTAGRGSSGKIELYGIKKLRELILELAVRGKLVPQDPNDEPASELLKHIAAEKAELVKQGKIKKPKPLPEISEEEKPFELPAGWEWIKISEIGHDWGQKTPDEDFTYIDVGSINKEYGIIEEPSILSAKDAPSRARKIVQKGTVIYSTVRPYLLNIAIIESAFSPEPIASTAFAIIHPYTAMNANFIYYYLRSPVFINYVESCQTGVAYPAINDKQFFSGIIAVPPSSEQARITKKIKELMSLCDQLEQHSLTSLDAHQQLVETLLTTLTDSQNADELTENWARISEHFDTLFTTEPSIEALKQTILQLAVMGKLVPQDPNDEPASELLKRIAQEKAQLVKDGKIKKQKPLPPISDEEKPFELPDGWEWCLFEDVVDIQSGITKGRNLANRKLISIPYLRVANVQRGYLDLSEVKEIDIPEEEKDKYHVIKGDLLITEGGDWDTVGRTTVWCHDWYIANQNHVFKGRIIGQDIDPYWLETYMNSPYSRDYFASASKQTTNLASINKTQLRGCPVAIPPSSEAEKIML